MNYDISASQKIEETVKKIKNREINVLDLVKEHIQRAHKSQKELNSFITILEDESLSSASEIHKKIELDDESIKDKRLLGIPFTAKDLYLVKDTKTTFGSKYMKDFIAPYTATVAQKLLDEGAILIGKTNCDPWGFGSTGENSGFGATKNAVNPDYVAGGSSSGSAASLASGVGFFSLGTDTGGSVRLPAAFNGLFGIKPTYGRNSRFGIGVMGSSFDTPGFFTRNLEDMILLEEIMQGKDIHDAATSDFGSPKELNKEKIKIGIPKEIFNEGLDTEYKEKIVSWIDSKKSDRIKFVDVSLKSLKHGLSAYYILVPSEISANRARYDGVRFGPIESEEYNENLKIGRSRYFEDEVKRRIMIGTFALSEGYSDEFYKKASRVREKLKSEFKNVFENVDYIISPVSPGKPPKLNENVNDPLKNYLLDIYNVTANLAGIPALSFPIDTDSEELPIGVQLMGNLGDDFDLINKTKTLLQNS